MENVADTYHLTRRGGGIWYYFRKVPKELVPVIGKRFIKRSLRTSDKAEAKKRRTVEEVRTDAYFAECFAQGVCSAPHMERCALSVRAGKEPRSRAVAMKVMPMATNAIATA